MTTRQALEHAHTTAAPAMGRLSLILASGRGLSPSVINELASSLEAAALSLRTITGEKRP